MSCSQEPLQPSTASPLSLGKRAVLWVIGGLFFGLGVLGMILPLMPTTVFWIVAAWCFARSSPRLHEAMLGLRWVGPSLRAWHEHRAMPARAKVAALGSVVFSFSASMLLLSTPEARALLGCVGLGVVLLLYRIPTLSLAPATRPRKTRGAVRNSCPAHEEAHV